MTRRARRKGTEGLDAVDFSAENRVVDREKRKRGRGDRICDRRVYRKRRRYHHLLSSASLSHLSFFALMICVVFVVIVIMIFVFHQRHRHYRSGSSLFIITICVFFFLFSPLLPLFLCACECFTFLAPGIEVQSCFPPFSFSHSQAECYFRTSKSLTVSVTSRISL